MVNDIEDKKCKLDKKEKLIEEIKKEKKNKKEDNNSKNENGDELTEAEKVKNIVKKAKESGKITYGELAKDLTHSKKWEYHF